MASYRKRARRTYKRARRGARNYVSNARSSYNRSGIKITKDPLYWGGFALGAFTDVDDKVPAWMKMALATMPISGPVISPVKHMAQGLVFGDAVDWATKGKLRVIGRGKTSSNIYA